MQDQLKNILHALAELEKRVAALEKAATLITTFSAGGPPDEDPPPKP